VHRARLERRKVGAGAGFRVADAEVDVTREDLGRKNSFCSSVPKRMIVGPTVLMVSIGTGAPARIDSSKKMNCSIAVAPLPPYSFGQPIPAQPSAHICFQTRRGASPMPCETASSATVCSSRSFS